MPQVRAAHSGGYSSSTRSFELLEAQRVARDVVAVEQALGDQHVHHAERERAVGAGQQRDVLRCTSPPTGCGTGSIAITLAPRRFGLLHARPEVQVGDDRVGAPDQDQLRLVEALRVHADRAAERRLEAGLAGATSTACGRAARRRAGGRSAGPSSCTAPCPWCRRSCSGRMVCGSSAASAFRRAAISSSASSQVMRSNLPSPFRPTRFMRIQQPVGRVGALEVVRDLGAQRAVGERHASGSPWIFVATPSSTVTSMRAGVGAVVRTGGAHHFVARLRSCGAFCAPALRR